MDNRSYQFQFVAGNLALDFVNTVAFRADPAQRVERLHCAEDVQRWASQAPLTDRPPIKFGTTARPETLRHIRAVREKLFAVFHAIASGSPISANKLVPIGNAFHNCCAKRLLSIDESEVRWKWRASARFSDYLLFPVLTSAVDLLTSDSLGLIRQCEDAGCGWLFLDRSNAQKRRWCSMADCGNRNKARRYYRRETGQT